jgi:hypothetical protein
MAVKITKFETHEGVTTWNIEIDGAIVGDMTREPLRRWAVGARKGTAVDKTKPVRWSTYIDGLGHDPVNIPDGATANEAKKIVRAVLG